MNEERDIHAAACPLSSVSAIKIWIKSRRLYSDGAILILHKISDEWDEASIKRFQEETSCPIKLAAMETGNDVISAVRVKVIQVKDQVDVLELLRCLKFARGINC